MNNIKTVNVLGMPWTVQEKPQSEDAKLQKLDGYCDQTIRACVVQDFKTDGSPMEVSNLNVLKKNTIRHEVIHAFLFESGLSYNSDWARNEEMVDWFAVQFPKLLAAFQHLECL